MNTVPASARARSVMAESCYFALKLAGWTAVTACCVAAVWIGVFVFLGEFSFARTVLHLDNFASRYLAANTGRRAGFEEIFWIVSAALFALFGLLRRHGLPNLRSNSKENGHG